MMKLLIFLFSFISYLDLSVSQYVQPGQCDPNIQLVNDFNVTNFFGTWYVLKRFQNPIQNGDCATLNFLPQNGSLTVYNRAVANNFLNEINGTATLQNGTAKFSVSINGISQPMDFWILPSALYTMNSLGYSCANLNSTHRNVYIWQLGRSTVSGDLIEANLNQTLLNLLGIRIDSLTVVDHSEAACTVLPDIQPGEPVILEGSCNENIRVVQNFNPSAFTGVWHQIASYATVNEIGSCRKAEYRLVGSAVSVTNSEVVNQKLRVISGNASVSSNDGSAKLQVTLEVLPGTFSNSSLWVLATDYSSYAISYTCVNLADNRRRVNSWILSRSRQLSQSAQVAVDDVIRSEVELNTRFYVQTNQSDDGCFYFPEPDPGQRVIFPGQCDETIQAIANFNATRYMGRWYNIESYPATSINGSCSKALYTLVDNYVQVNNSQVLNQRLYSITGTAVINSTDNSGKLLVSFPSTGNTPNTANYYVLDTDYDSYAVVYSCENINSEQRRVTGFKLGRSKQLNSSALAAIDRAMGPIPVMDQRYFVPQSHSEESCFYNPEPQQGVPVVFPGRCDDNINVVQNFNLTEFVGTWYEIQSYPIKEKQGSQCVNHVLTQVSNTTLSSVSSFVIDQFLNVVNATISLASNNNSAKMIMTLRSENNVNEIPFWILDTDYSNYALAYGCVNIDEDYRLVYSWKLGRSQQLSQNNIQSINSAMSNVNVLQERYFETKNHTPASCFFLPDIPKGEPIILNGQCDLNIPVVQNFNASAYLGNWRLIESYPSNFQNGTCNRANYNLAANNTIVVTNSQVNNQSLTVVIGSAWLLSSGKLEVDLPGTNRTIEYWVLDTDYSSYSLVYSCENLDATRRRVWSWKMSRTRDLTQNAIQNINRVVDSIDVLNNRYYEVLDHSDNGCFYLPTPNPNSPVIFPGQCDPNINVVNNFRATEYMNLWHNIASYPSVFQNGTCNNANYKLLPNGTVDVLNTQVINQTLDTINLSGRLASNDGSAKLIVTIPAGNGFLESPYWVLDTDYSSYALVYTCINIDDERRQVLSWKLSRTKQLSANASAAIDRIVNNVPVLNEQYYVQNDQTKEGCFYYPEPQAGVVVEFPGQCENVQGIQNFNMSLFQGVWHEIEAYPKEQQSGQCISHNYTVTSARTLNLLSRNVFNQELGVTNSTVTFASNQETNGNLTITLNSGGQVITIPFIVLSTDYQNYALAYSCVNLTNDFRKVFSWKLSRNKFLSNESRLAINNAMANITVLENRYYENINQTNNACFYLPTPEPGKPVTFEGQCDESIPVVSNFAAARYLGRWLLIESYPTVNQLGECNDANYTLNSDGTVDVYNTEVLNQTLLTINGTAVVASNDGSAKLNVYFPTTTEPAPYWVLDTDYTSFALVYSCRNSGNNSRTVTTFKLSRNNTLSPAAIARIDQKISQIDVLNERYFNKVNRTDEACFYLPTPGPESPVFRGRCDENITVVQNFNATAYLGLWYDLSRYPVRFQYGSCPTATYEASSIGVDVFNTEVVDQRLSTIRGSAVIDSNDGSAKLLVSFPVAGTNLTTSTPYWVLATDYNSYALVYSCVNVDEESRRVSSWKLSRTKQLSANASAAIDRIVNNVPVLNEQYYRPSDQTKEGCFYYPEPQAGVVVEFPGQCENVQGIQNFNMSLFQGVWHEIEAYPKEQQSGQCISHNYTVTSARTLNLLSRNVFNQELGVTNSTVTFASNQETNGNLTITLNSGGQVITIPFIVLSTDYQNYALAYSCVNLTNDFRKVFSWKLSRNKFLSNESRLAINNAMANITVLENRYYENINQTNNACFYLPTPEPGKPVTFEGQCDESIPVVSNFAAARYLGRWLLIESYPTVNQLGECNDANYTLNSDGTVDVYNTEVLNQTLLTINGTAVVASNDGSAKLNVYFPTTTEPAPYWVLDTDYTSFALVYSCRNSGNNSRTVTTFKLSRNNTLSPAAIARIDQKISQIDVLNERYFNKVNRTDEACFYLPTPGPESPVFRGRCDENITVVQNFNATAYLGLWYDIASYPVRFQYGTCPTATYEASSIGVDVFNTEVVDQRLSTIRGSAVIDSNDGSAKLLVSFPVAGTNLTTRSPYWVLATDYSSYALVYSCVNVDEESRRVSSWKLSRNKFLSEASIANINNVINSVPVLNEMYYNTRGHSDENCFYYPDNNGGPVVQSGQCANNLNIVNNFNISSFAGTWFEISRFPSELQNGECVYSNFEVNNQNINMRKSMIFNERIVNVLGNAVVSSDGRGIITVNLTNENGDRFATRFQVLDVDYNDFALLHNCRNLNSTHKQVYSWKLSRSKSGLSPAAITRINQLVSNTSELFEGYYDVTDQTSRGCFYYPDFPQPPSSIILPGPCNETIRAKPNFNTTAYLGKWYEIASYPQAFQFGECARAQYSAGNNVVNVLNTQVVNRTLDVQTATAVVASNDNSGLLEVTFVLSNGVINVVNYYVLETDYTSFSLVYSCRNTSDGNRQVSSWKLSRDKVLPNNSIPIIDNIIKDTQGLREEYYQPTSQSDEDCFYIPEFDRTKAAVFRGQCQNITGMQGFDAQRYLGWWHEIQRYPTDNDAGACISSNFRANGNQIQVTDTNIFGISAQVAVNNVTISNDGRIRRILSNGNIDDVWVLTTDYHNYSLLYSCENVNGSYRRVWSAKHSKDRQLTPEAESAMASIINSTDTLVQQFYIPVSQSDEACFHYPEQSGDQIILPGQCDPNIPVVQNFDAAKYTGTWYQIEKYPQRFENGTCIGARYTLDEQTGVVDVLNWQVVNGTLDTIEGNATLISTDGSAKLIVNLPIRGRNESGTVSMELYVLKTDYVTYSLAYSCVNINKYERAVAAWKLSRTRTMTDQSNSEINAYINSRQELHQPYFERVEQSDDCEEPNSSYLVRSSIILILVCSVLRFLY